MTDKRKLILVTEIALSYDNSICLARKLIREKKIVLALISCVVMSRSNNLENVTFGNTEEVNCHWITLLR